MAMMNGRDQWTRRRLARIAVRILLASTLALVAGPLAGALIVFVSLWPIVLLSMVFPPYLLLNPVILFIGLVVAYCIKYFAPTALFIFVVLPLISIGLPSNYWMQQLGIVVLGTGSASAMAIARDLTPEGVVCVALAGLVASAVFARCVQDVWDVDP